MPFLSSAFAFDLFGFGVYTFPQGVAGAMSFHDPLEGTETSEVSAQVNTACGQQPSHRKSLALYAARRLTGDLPAREWHLCDCTPGCLGGQCLVLAEHLHQAKHMSWHMSLHKRGNAVAVRVADNLDH